MQVKKVGSVLGPDSGSGRAATQMQVGLPWPLGAHVVQGGINFAVASADSTAMELCLFGSQAEASPDEQRMWLPGRTGDVWHGHLPAAGAGLIYGYRAHGAWQPEAGLKFNADKLLLDPYAREIVGEFEWRDEQFGYDTAAGPMVRSASDNASVALKARVVADAPFDWGSDRPPAKSMQETVLYETHVKGFTRQHPGVPDNLRGTYAGLAHPASMKHLQRLGITAVSLLPVHQHIDEQRLVKMGLRNYWGYNTIGFFAPEPTYAASGSAGARNEFREMVRTLHAAGIEVVLDVVFNHSAETDELGPTISWRGLDNAHSYRLPADRAFYENQTGCGNTFDIRQPRVLQLVMDSLRYWVQEMHVDGFRFDLAPVLARDGADGGFDPFAAFFKTAAQDPVLRGVKLIAEPWDIGAHGYRLGQFPAGWMEWNDRYRDTSRSFWLAGGHDDFGKLGALAQRASGSADLFRTRGRQPAESVNFIVAHDGFTLHDLVSYDHKHNEANGEGNRDGHGHNLSWNCGHEGPTRDPVVMALRSRFKRALLGMLLLGLGTPMLCAGDELGHTQQGNNNPYCQDNPTTWIDWAKADDDLIAFTAALVALRRELMPLGTRWNDSLGWLRPDGKPMQDGDWQGGSRVLGCFIAEPEPDREPERHGRSLLLLINGSADDVRFAVPALGKVWNVLVDSAAGIAVASVDAHSATNTRATDPPSKYLLAGRSIALLAAER